MTNDQRKRDLRRAYKERPKPAGVFHIKNTVDDKRLLGSSLNLDGSLNRHRFMLSCNAHPNTALQTDWNRHGADAFVFEILEVVSPTDAADFDPNEELTLLELLWLDKLDPIGDHGYNKTAKIRDR